MPTEQKRTTVNQLINRAVMLAGGTVLFVSLTILYVYISQNTENKRAVITTHARAVDANVRETLDYMDSMAHQLASTQELINLVEFGEADEIEAWTQRTRRLLPHTVGLSLVDAEGEVVGNPALQRIGPACRKDVHAFIKHEDVDYPLVHNENPDLAHFDLVQPIIDNDGNDAGLLLISFSLNGLQQSIQSLVREGYGYRLATVDEKEIFSHGLGPDFTFDVIQSLTGTDWILEVYGDDRSQEVLQTAAVSMFIVLAAFLLLAIGVGQYLKKAIVTDIQQLEQLLGFKSMRIAGNEWQNKPIQLQETAGLVKAIKSLSLEVSNSYERLTSEAMTDVLTGLYNRRALELAEERYYRMAEEDIMVILMLLDIDHFKQINDEYGHPVGDQALEILSQTLRENTRATDDVYRLGGDELLVVFGMGKMEGLNQWYRRMAEGFADSMGRVSNRAIRKPLTLSAGACVIEPEKDKNFKEALSRADQALYTAKDRGRDKLVVM